MTLNWNELFHCSTHNEKKIHVYKKGKNPLDTTKRKDFKSNDYHCWSCLNE